MVTKSSNHACGRAAQPTVAAGRAVQIVDIPAMLSVNTAADAGEGGDKLAIDRREIARVHHVGTQLTQQLPQTPVRARILARALAQRMDLHVGTPDPPAEIRRLGEAYDGMPIARGRQMVDEIDQPVLQAADSQAVHDVHDEWGAGRIGGCGCRHLSHAGAPGRAHGALTQVADVGACSRRQLNSPG